MRAQEAEDNSPRSQDEPLSAYQLKQKLTWAALIKAVYEVNPLECPRCGSEMKIVGFIERDNDGLIRSLLKQARLWKDFVPRLPGRSPQAKTGAPPKTIEVPPAENIPCVAEPVLSAVEVPVEYVRDAEYFNTIC